MAACRTTASGRDDYISAWATVTVFSDLILTQPEKLLLKARETKEQGLAALKSLFLYVKQNEPLGVDSPLKELVVDGFDVEQIWEELVLQSEPLLEYMEKTLKNFQKTDFVLQVCW